MPGAPTPPPINRDLRAPLARLRADGPTAYTLAMLPQLRAAQAEREITDRTLRQWGWRAENVKAEGTEDSGADVPLLICQPPEHTPVTGVLYALHGGGMVVGSNRGRDLTVYLDAAGQAGLAVVAPNYRLAPEHPYPAALHDSYAGLKWTVDNAAALGTTPDRIVLTGGSAGGGLAAATALFARERGDQPAAGQLLISPMLDDRNDSVSAGQMVGHDLWDRDANALGWAAALGDRAGGDDVPCTAAPARAEDLTGLPPAHLDVGSGETLRDEVVTYASRLWAAGGDAELHVWPGAFHGSDAFVPNAGISRRARDRRADWLRHLLRR